MIILTLGMFTAIIIAIYAGIKEDEKLFFFSIICMIISCIILTLYGIFSEPKEISYHCPYCHEEIDINSLEVK